MFEVLSLSAHLLSAVVHRSLNNLDKKGTLQLCREVVLEHRPIIDGELSDAGSSLSEGEITDLVAAIGILAEGVHAKRTTPAAVLGNFIHLCAEAYRLRKFTEVIGTMEEIEGTAAGFKESRRKVDLYLKRMGVCAWKIRRDPRAPILLVEFDPERAQGPAEDYRYYF